MSPLNSRHHERNSLLRYALLIGKLFHVYAALEGSLDRSNSPAVKLMWEAHVCQPTRLSNPTPLADPRPRWTPIDPCRTLDR
jgi:hypothetical protein